MRRTFQLTLVGSLGIVEGEALWLKDGHITLKCPERLPLRKTIDARFDLGTTRGTVDFAVYITKVGERARGGFLHAGRYRVEKADHRARLEERLEILHGASTRSVSNLPNSLSEPPPTDDSRSYTSLATWRRRALARQASMSRDPQVSDVWVAQRRPRHETSRSTYSISDVRNPRKMQPQASDVPDHQSERGGRSERRKMGRSLTRAALRENNSSIEGASAELSARRRTAPAPNPAPRSGLDQQRTSTTRHASDNSHRKTPSPAPPRSVKLAAQVAPGSPPTVFIPAMDAGLAKTGIVAHGSRVQVTVASAGELRPGAAIHIVLQLPDNTYHQFGGRVDKTSLGQSVLVSDELPLPLISPIRNCITEL